MGIVGIEPGLWENLLVGPVRIRAHDGRAHSRRVPLESLKLTFAFPTSINQPHSTSQHRSPFPYFVGVKVMPGRNKPACPLACRSADGTKLCQTRNAHDPTATWENPPPRTWDRYANGYIARSAQKALLPPLTALHESPPVGRNPISRRHFVP